MVKSKVPSTGSICSHDWNQYRIEMHSRESRKNAVCLRRGTCGGVADFSAENQKWFAVSEQLPAGGGFGHGRQISRSNDKGTADGVQSKHNSKGPEHQENSSII
jgi:hypothetical protein